MWPFRRKIQYKIVWRYNLPEYSYTEIIKAHDKSHAWRLLKRRRCLPIALVSIEEI